MQINSYGKINLYLKVKKGKNNTQHYKLDSLIIPYNEIYDIIKIKENDDNKIRFIHKQKILDPYRNSVVKTIKYFFNEHRKLELKKNISVEIIKNAPLQSGLGYVESNAIATYRLLHQYYNIGLKETNLYRFAQTTGVNGVFFLYNKPAFLKGYGNKIKFYEKEIDLHQFKVITNSDITPDSGKVLNKFFANYKYYIKNVKTHIENDNEENKYINHLEIPCFDLYPKLYSRYIKLRKTYKHVMLIGSGASFLCFN